MGAMGRGPRIALIAVLVAVAASASASARIEPKVVGGHQATIDRYPWQVALVFDPAKVAGNPRQRQFCGGTLLTPSIVLTAAHCVFDTDPEDGSSLDADDVDVVVGQSKLSTAPAAFQVPVRSVSFEFDYEPDFGAAGSGVPNNDVAFLVLASPQTQHTIQIAGPDETALWDEGSIEDVTGWGATAETGPGRSGSDLLQSASVPILFDSVCESDYGDLIDPVSMLCAGYPDGGTDTCFGDSGGPMQAPLDGGGYRLVGITSWGNGCARPNAPGVYTRVAGRTLRNAVADQVLALEDAFALPHEEVIGGGGEPKPDPPPQIGEPTGPPAAPGSVTGQRSNPKVKSSFQIQKCRRAATKLKRQRCIKKVRQKQKLNAG